MMLSTKGGEKVTAYERRMEILRMLLIERHTTLSSIQIRFGVSRATAWRDIQELSLSHPIQTAPGKYSGGIYILDGYYLGMKYLSEEQVTTLELLVDSSNDEQREVLTSILKTFKKPNSKY